MTTDALDAARAPGTNAPDQDSASLAPIADGVYAAETWMKVGPGVCLPLRMTVLVLPDQGLLLYSPIAIDDRLADTLQRLGPVRFAVAPNLFHHLYLGAVRDRFPDVTLLGPPGLGKKRPDLSLDGVLRPPEADAPGGARADGPTPGEAGLPPGIRGIYWGGERVLRETLLVHEPSGTLIAGDVFMNVHDAPGWLSATMMRLEGTWKRPGVPRILGLLRRDRAAMAASAEAIRVASPRRIVPAHGRVVTDDVPALLDRALAPYC